MTSLIEASMLNAPSHGRKLTLDPKVKMHKFGGLNVASSATLLSQDEIMFLVTGQENPSPDIKEHCTVGEVNAATKEIKYLIEESDLDNEQARRIHENAEHIREVVRRHILGSDWEAPRVLDDELKVRMLDYAKSHRFDAPSDG